MKFKFLIEKIIQSGSEFKIVSKKGKQLGKFSSRKQALKRLRQIEFFKHIKS
jgi:hypothetical protein